ncbi:MAG: glycoside hydrolase family 127 protein [Candidatus Hydrogenedens sp.]|nr:glycoside hydrolase family 127 protein [Candidatus Hydrogenedens sp.]
MIISVSVFCIISSLCVAEDAFLSQIPIDSIKVGGEFGRRMQTTIYNNSMVIDIDEFFLDDFRKKEDCDGYVGMGKTIDAFAKFAKYTNDPNVIKKKEYIVNTILGLQEPDGYIGYLKPECRVWTLWDIAEISYIILGLLTEYRLFDNEKAFDGAKRAGDYLIEKMSPYPGRIPAPGDLCWEMGTIGVEDAMLSLYEETKDTKYLNFVKDYMRLPQWDMPIVKGRWGKVEGHVYTYIKRCMEKQKLYRIEPDEDLLTPSKRVMDFLLKGNGLVITGTSGQHECWHDTQEGIANLGETCATAYLIRWWDELLRWFHDSRYADLMERTIYNALFAAQSPDGRKIRYYTPFEGKRVYFDQDNYCCPCNYRRMIADIPCMVYYLGEKGIYVSLYTQSKANMKLKNTNLEIAQDTRYPSDGKVKLSVNPSNPEVFSIFLRIPLWCKTFEVMVNGEKVSTERISGGSWYEIRREWKKDDVIELSLDMKVRFIKGVQVQAGRCALMYGPVVFCMSTVKNPYLKEVPIRAITIDLNTVEGPFRDDSIREDGLMLKVKGWRTTTWYPHAKYDYDNIVLTEFPDPDGEITYFHVPNPEDPLIENDEFLGMNIWK